MYNMYNMAWSNPDNESFTLPFLSGRTKQEELIFTQKHPNLAYCRMLPVQDDLRDVVSRVQQVVVPPFVPVDGHCPIFVHAV